MIEKDFSRKVDNARVSANNRKKKIQAIETFVIFTSSQVLF